MSRPSFPPTIPAIRHRLPSTGSSGASSPASRVLRSAPTPCRPSGRTSLPSLGRTALGSLVAPRRGRARLPGSWALVTRCPPGFGAETTGPPGFLGSPTAHMPRSSTAAEGGAPRPDGAPPAAFRNLNGVGLRKDPSYAAPSRGLCAPCARFAAPVTRRHATPGSRCWLGVAGRDSHPPGSEKKFPAYVMPSPPSRLCPAH